MKKWTFFCFLFFISCSNKDQKFCDCIKQGEELSKFSQQFFTKAPSPKQLKKWNQLKKQKKILCQDYQEMSGDIMRVKKSKCEE